MIVVSVNYRTTPIQLREKVSFQQTELIEAMAALQEEQEIVENIILSTCNRTEIYAVVKTYELGVKTLTSFLADWFHVSVDMLKDHLLIYRDDQAFAHLFRVSAGIDSMVVGETQILGQVRTSFLQGQSIGTTSTVFNELFNRAIAFSKRAHAETNIGDSTVSISYAAVQLLQQTLGHLHEQRVLLIGAGEMSTLTIQHLKGSGVQDITIVNRTFQTALEVARTYELTALSIEQLQMALKGADIVISSTGAAEAILQYEAVQQVMKDRPHHPLYCVDIAVPRDIEATVGRLPAVHLYDIDDIQQIVDANLAERKVAATKIAAKIGAQVHAFNEWLAKLQVVPTMTALQRKGQGIQQATLTSLQNKLPNLTERERAVIALHTQSIVNQLLREPIKEAKALALKHENDQALTAFQKTFGIDGTCTIDAEKEVLAKCAKERLQMNCEN